MSGRNQGKYWSISLLKRRGWTNELICELLPGPRYIPSNGHTVRIWDKEDVRLAEQDPRFPRGSRNTRSDAGAVKTPAPGTRHARTILNQAWEAAKTKDSAPWLLAEHYHNAILTRLPGAAKGRSLRPSQATA